MYTLQTYVNARFWGTGGTQAPFFRMWRLVKFSFAPTPLGGEFMTDGNVSELGAFLWASMDIGVPSLQNVNPALSAVVSVATIWGISCFVPPSLWQRWPSLPHDSRPWGASWSFTQCRDRPADTESRPKVNAGFLRNRNYCGKFAK